MREEITEKELLNIMFALTHLTDEEGNDVPNFCFASDVAVDTDKTEDDIAKLALNNGYKVFKVFPGETMMGGLLIVAEGASIEPVENMYKEFYGEVPEITEMKLEDDNLVELDEDLEIENEASIDDNFLFGDYQGYMNSKKKEAEDLGATLEFKTIVGPFRNSSVWYENEGTIATLKYKDYFIEIFVTDEIAELTLEDGEGSKTLYGIADFEDAGIFNDHFWPEDYLDCCEPCFEFAVRKSDKGWETSYGMDFDSAWSLNEALDINWYIREVIPFYNDCVGITELEESNNKRHKITARDPNAQAMWGRTRHRVELPKKGKGSFKRHSKHKDDLKETLVSPGATDVERLRDILGEAGWEIETTKEVDSFYSNEGLHDIHLQIYTTRNDIEHDDTFKETADTYWEGLCDALDKFDPDEKMRCTASMGYGGTGVTGMDMTGRFTAGVDLRPFWVDDDIVSVTEDLDYDEEDSEFVVDSQVARDYMREVAKKLNDAGFDIDFRCIVNPRRLRGEWYDNVDIPFIITKGRYEIRVCPSDAYDYYLDDEEETVLCSSKELEDAGIFTDEELEGIEDYGDYSDISYCISSLDGNDNVDNVYFNDDFDEDNEMTLDVFFNPEFLDRFIEIYQEVVEENGDTDLDESKKKKNPLKDAAKKHNKSASKKNAIGWFVHPNVEQGIQAFNHAMGAVDAPSTITAPAGLGEEITVDDADTYTFEFLPPTHWHIVGSKPDGTDADGWVKYKDVHYNRIPETCMKVSRDDYMNNKLLKQRKNRRVLLGVEKYFKDHPKAKWCVISCKDVSKGYERFANVYRALIEQKDSRRMPLRESSNDYWVLSDGLNPRNSLVISSIGDFETFIQKLEKLNNETDSYWELLHYEYGTPIKVWTTEDGIIAWPDEDPIPPVRAELSDDELSATIDDLIDSNPDYYLNETVEKHETLNPKLWNEDGTLKEEVREKIMEIVNDFLEGLADDEIKFNLKDIKLVGSNCSYNYNDKSDLDIHLVADTKSLNCPDNLYPLLYSAYRSLYNKNRDIDFYGIPVEIFVETDDTEQMNDEPIDN